MKFVHITVHFEFSEEIEDCLSRQGVQDYVCYPKAIGSDLEGKHDGTQVFPGHFTVYQLLAVEERISGLLEELRSFKQANHAHEHIRAAVMPVETLI